jgi:putative ABC transport system permease protein
VVSESRATEAVTLADRHGVALAGRAGYYAAGFALLLALLGLGLVAGVERRDRAEQAAVLRAQGVRGTVLAAAGRRRQLWPLAAALVLGPLVAAGAWVLARTAVPTFPDTGWPVPPPAVVDPRALLVPWLVAAVALLAGAALTLGGTRTDRSDRKGARR